MKVNVNQKLVSVDGVEQLKDPNGRTLILQNVCINALCTPIQTDDEKKKWEKYELYKKVRDTGVRNGEELIVDLKVEELFVIKSLIGKSQSQLVMGQCWEMLEGKK